MASIRGKTNGEDQLLEGADGSLIAEVAPVIYAF